MTVVLAIADLERGTVTKVGTLQVAELEPSRDVIVGGKRYHTDSLTYEYEYVLCSINSIAPANAIEADLAEFDPKDFLYCDEHGLPVVINDETAAPRKW